MKNKIKIIIGAIIGIILVLLSSYYNRDYWFEKGLDDGFKSKITVIKNAKNENKKNSIFKKT